MAEDADFLPSTAVNYEFNPSKSRPEVVPLMTKLVENISHKCRVLASKEFWLKRVPLLQWLPDYNHHLLLGDLIAGCTTALTVIPQGVGYAPLAGLPLQYGLYASLMPGFVYCVTGTTKELTIGPTAVNALMSYNYAGPEPYRSVTLAFYCGIIEFLVGLFNLGFLVMFISGPVMKAFSSAVAIQVITSQVKGLFGLKYPARGFLRIWIGFFENITSVKIPDLGSSLLSFTFLVLVKKLKECKKCEGSDPTSLRAVVVRRTKWLLGTSINCILLLVGSCIAYGLQQFGFAVLDLTGEVEGGLPLLQLPWQFGLNSTGGNVSDTELIDPIEMIPEFGSGLVMIPLVSILQHLAIGKHYHGTNKLAASQEVAALGLCQTVGAFVGSLPVTASFGRSAVNAASGVKSTFGGVVTGCILILACAVLSPYLSFIPTSVLSAVIIFSMISTIAVDLPLKLWRTSRNDLPPCLLTFLLGLFLNVETGLIVGTLVHLGILVFYTSKVKVHIEEKNGYLLVRPDRGLFFPSVDSVRSQLSKLAAKYRETNCQRLVIDLGRVPDVDHDSAVNLLVVLKNLGKCDNFTVVFCRTNHLIKKHLLLLGTTCDFFDTEDDAGEGAVPKEEI